MRYLLSLIIVVDLAFIVVCLSATRTGMEAMGVALFMQLPLAALHLLLAVPVCLPPLLKGKVKLPLYFVLSTALMFGSFYLYGTQNHGMRPVYRVLLDKAKQQQRKVSAYKETLALKIRQKAEEKRNPDHAALCQSLRFPVDINQLTTILGKNAEISTPCAVIHGREVLPVFLITAEQFPLWAKADRKKRKQISSNIRSAITILLAHGADVNSRDESGNTLLQWAVRYDDELLAALLINNKACIYSKTNKGFLPLSAVQSSRFNILLTDASRNPEVLENCPDILSAIQLLEPQQQPPAKGSPEDYWTRRLRSAAAAGNFALALDCIMHGAAVNAFDRYGYAALHQAVKGEKSVAGIVELLLAAGADINGRARPGYTAHPHEFTPLIAAVKNGRSAAVALLLAKGADPNLADQDGYTPLHYLALGWKPEKMGKIIDLLLEAGADINARDRLGYTPLMMTAYNNPDQEKATAVLLAKGADPNLTDNQGNTFLHQLVAGSSRKNPAKTITLLTKRGATLNQSNRTGSNALISAVKKQDVALVKQLLAGGADPNVLNKRKESLLYSVTSCKTRKQAIFEAFLAAGCNVNIHNETRYAMGETALHRALAPEITCLAPAEHLLRAGADPNSLNSLGLSPLYKLAYWQNKDPFQGLKLLQKYGAEINFRNKEGRTPVMYAAFDSTGSVILQAFIEAGADIGATDNYGNTLLHLAAENCKEGAGERIRLLLKNISDFDRQNDYGKNPLDIALKRKNSEAVQSLTAAGAHAQTTF
jgi:ankyrin repeat protein